MRSTDLEGPLPDGGTGRIEKCGLLCGREGRVTHVEAAANVSAAPLDSFEIAPAALLRAYRRQREPGGLELMGFYHTHPFGEAYPSIRDAESAAPDGKLWLIATATRATLWRTAAEGQVHGRFDAVRFHLRTGKRVDKGVAGVQIPRFGLASAVSFREPPF